MYAIRSYYAHKPITIFEYEPMTPKGCDYHPDIEDHKIMAQQLA